MGISQNIRREEQVQVNQVALHKVVQATREVYEIGHTAILKKLGQAKEALLRGETPSYLEGLLLKAYRITHPVEKVEMPSLPEGKVLPNPILEKFRDIQDNAKTDLPIVTQVAWESGPSVMEAQLKANLIGMETREDKTKEAREVRVFKKALIGGNSGQRKSSANDRYRAERSRARARKAQK